MNYNYYDTLNKPIYAPDKSVFRKAWTFLYIVMAISFVIMYFLPLTFSKFLAIPTFFFQLMLNILWPFIFFKFKKIGIAFVVCLLLLATVLIMTKLFFQMSFLLGILQIPYILWLIFATRLNFDFMRLN